MFSTELGLKEETVEAFQQVGLVQVLSFSHFYIKMESLP